MRKCCVEITYWLDNGLHAEIKKTYKKNIEYPYSVKVYSTNYYFQKDFKTLEDVKKTLAVLGGDKV